MSRSQSEGSINVDEPTQDPSPVPKTLNPVHSESEPQPLVVPPAAVPAVGVELLCTVRELLKKLNRRVLVGDDVVMGSIDWVEKRGVVDDVVLPRRSVVYDPPVANVDHMVILFALAQPQPPEAPACRAVAATRVV